MQRPDRDKESSSIRTGRTEPALPGATMPTVPTVTALQKYPARLYEPQSPPKKRANPARRALLQLLGLGFLLEALFLAFYPLLANITPESDAAKRALLATFPWIARLYWTTAFPELAHVLAQVPLFDAATRSGAINFLALLLGFSCVLVLAAARIGSRVVRERLSRGYLRTLLCAIIALTLVFGLTYLFMPAVLSASHDMFLYGFYGRLVTVYHVNPYSVSAGAFPRDLMYPGASIQGSRTPGPVWIDLCIPVALLARESVANFLFGFRIVGLLAHLINTMLIWAILAKLKPQVRISATLLYAWNPLVLLLSIFSMHLDVVLVFFILLAILFFQRKSPILGLVLVLLSLLMNVLLLLLLPFFLRLLVKETRIMGTGRRVLWWLAAAVISSVVVVLAYAPYWQGWGIRGLLASTQQAFLQDTAINSLNAALVNLPIKLPVALSWLIMPHHWTILAAVTAGCLLLLGLWLADSLDFVVLFSSWILLALLILLPTYWPWYLLLPLALALCSASRYTLLLVLLLTLGGLASYCFWLWQPVWTGQAFVTIGLPVLIWGWILFFASTWGMVHAREPEPAVTQVKRRGLSRPPFASRPSWPGRRAQ